MITFTLVLISLTVLAAIVCIHKESAGYSNKEVKEMNEMLKKCNTPTERTGPILQYLVDKGVQDIRKQVTTDVEKAQKRFESL